MEPDRSEMETVVEASARQNTNNIMCEANHRRHLSCANHGFISLSIMTFRRSASCWSSPNAPLWVWGVWSTFFAFSSWICWCNDGGGSFMGGMGWGELEQNSFRTPKIPPRASQRVKVNVSRQLTVKTGFDVWRFFFVSSLLVDAEC